TSLAEAHELLRQFGDEAKLLAGGHSLLPTMKLRLAQPAHLIDIGGIADLRYVQGDGGFVRIGALSTHHDLETDGTVRKACPLLAEVAAVIGDRQVRNRGTIGGALAHADPAADYPAAILALEATIVAQGPSGSREIAAEDFFVDLLTTSLAPDEVVTEVRIPIAQERTGAAYEKLANQASGYATVGVAAVLTFGGDGTCTKARVGITGAAAVATRARGVEAALEGYALSEDVLAAAAGHAADGLELLDDVHASTDYRRRVTAGLTRRALSNALQRLG
ncbi:MAG TPA: xanthine dehydrogenase family protein subunit M, partial [Thermomicrobiales bacterium]|nr:xanthine dehydrogenase family protein subunit M [Thermomicrobiales bacterium]